MVSRATNTIIVIAALIQIANSIPIDFGNRVNDDETAINPVILIPGLEGSRLEALVQKDFACRKAGNYYFHIWLNEIFLLPGNIDCFTAILEMHPPSEQRVVVRVSGFGSTEALEDLGPDIVLASTAKYMRNLVDSLVDAGYTRNVSIKGAPYDFRLSPYELKDNYFDKLDGLIYETYLTNDGRKSVLICHSLGCLVVLAYLRTKPQSWKDTYIHRLITVAAPFGGTVKALKAVAVGDNMGLFMYNREAFKPMERSFPSLAFLLPNPTVFEDAVIMETPQRQYRSTDYPAIFDFINATNVRENWNNSKDMVPDIDFPGVDVTCIYSIDKQTPSVLKFTEGYVTSNLDVEEDYGDGTVNLKSLQYCHKWVKMYPKYDISIKVFKKISHYDLIRHEDSVRYITRALFS